MNNAEHEPMRPQRERRLQQVERGIAATPLRESVVDAAFANFRKYGDLPEQQRLADAVCRRALGGKYLHPTNADPTQVDLERLIHITVHRLEEEKEQPPSVRERVFDEAVFGDVLQQRAARIVLEIEVVRGGDPADPQFLADRTMPDHAGVSMHLLGYPERLAKPPYVAQGKRLFARYDELRRRINRYESDPWFDLLVDAVIRFEDTGDLPDDELLRDTVLAHEEWMALHDHARGRDVREWMAVLDTAARAKGARREEALANVQQFVRARRLPDRE